MPAARPRGPHTVPLARSRGLAPRPLPPPRPLHGSLPLEDVRAILLARLHNAAPTNNARNRLNAPTLAKIHRSVSQLLPGQPTVARRIHQQATLSVCRLRAPRRRRSPWLQPTQSRERKKKIECAWLLLLSYASGLLASSSDSQTSTLVASGVLVLRALLLCFARAPALLTRPPAETEHKMQKKVRCAWLLLLSNPSRLLASLALYSLPSYHSGSSALVASGVFGLEAVSGLHMLLLCSHTSCQ